MQRGRKEGVYFACITFIFKGKKREKITHVLTIKENHCSFFYKSHVLLQLELQLEHSGNVYALQYYSDYVAYLLCMKIF